MINRIAHAMSLACVVLFGCSSDDEGDGPNDGAPADAAVDAASQPDAANPSTQDAGPDASACSGNQVSCDGTCIDPIAPTGSAMVERIFAKSCGFASSCHGGTSPKEGLALDTVDHLFSSAVDKPSTQKSGKLIAPGDGDASYLLHKLQGEQLAAGTTIMPQPPSDPLCPAKIDAIRAWIEAGTPR